MRDAAKKLESQSVMVQHTGRGGALVLDSRSITAEQCVLRREEHLCLRLVFKLPAVPCTHPWTPTFHALNAAACFKVLVLMIPLASSTLLRAALATNTCHASNAAARTLAELLARDLSTRALRALRVTAQVNHS
jgi:hypothetical protein